MSLRHVQITLTTSLKKKLGIIQWLLQEKLQTFEKNIKRKKHNKGTPH